MLARFFQVKRNIVSSHPKGNLVKIITNIFLITLSLFYSFAWADSALDLKIALLNKGNSTMVCAAHWVGGGVTPEGLEEELNKKIAELSDKTNLTLEITAIHQGCVAVRHVFRP